jgi:hypothetical protein
MTQQDYIKRLLKRKIFHFLRMILGACMELFDIQSLFLFTCRLSNNFFLN